MKQALSVLAFGSILLTAACSAPSQSGALRALPVGPDGSSNGYQILHTFSSAEGTPYSLVAMGNALYGLAGSNYSNDSAELFRVDSSGGFQVLHVFRTSTPTELVPFHSNLYAFGACPGGTSGCRSLLRITPSGEIHVVRTYSSEHAPSATLIVGNGTLYGIGGASIFVITRSGAYRTLYTFQGSGRGDIGAIIFANGTLYGTTDANPGAVFSLTPSGVENTIYTFKGGADGAFPAGLVYEGGMLFGVTFYGGTNSCFRSSSGPPTLQMALCGTLYSLTLSGVKNVLYDFNTDGAFPAGLIDASGTFYGVTGGEDVGGGLGTSAIFAFSAGQYTVLHNFGGKGDAMWAGYCFTKLHGVIYGTGYGFLSILYRQEP